MEIEMKCPECDMPRLHYMLMGKMWCSWCKGWFSYDEVVKYNSRWSHVENIVDGETSE